LLEQVVEAACPRVAPRPLPDLGAAAALLTACSPGAEHRKADRTEFWWSGEPHTAS
jgi:hypothetical protein